MTFEEFLKSRNISQDTIDYFKNEKIDPSTILMLPEEDLKNLIPKHGDRIAITNFCKKFKSNKKQSLIEKLKNKMLQKRSDSGSSESSGNSENTKKLRKKKDTRIIEIGWLCLNETDQMLRQVRTKSGGGTRRIEVVRTIKCGEILNRAKELFFPDGTSTKGKIEDFEVELLDYKSHKADLDLTVSEMYDISALTTLRFYLSTIPIPKQVVEMSDYDEDHFIEATVSSDKSNDGHSERTSPLSVNMSALDHYEDRDFQFPSPDTGTLMENNSMGIYPENYNSDEQPDVAFELSDLLQIPERKTLVLHRANIFEDMLKAFEHDFFDNGLLSLELILPTGEKELAEDLGGVWRDVLSDFWNTFYEKCTVGTTHKIPYIRHDFGELQWRAIAKILLKGFIMEEYVPIKISQIFLKTCCNCDIVDEDLMHEFLNYVCESDRNILEQALQNFDEINVEDIIEVFSSYDSKWLPNKNNLRQLIRDIAHIELIQKPAFVVKCFQREWHNQSINIEKIFDLYEKCKPTVKNCLAKIELEDEQSIDPEKKVVFNYLRKFVKESDEKTREAFFRFCTGSNLPIIKIKVAFLDTKGIKRLPIAHTCSGLLQLPSTYENFVTLRTELNSVLTANIWIMDIV